MNKIKVLVCDDSALMRRSLKKMIESDPNLTVVGTARDGEDSVNKARELRPDVITMDVVMPGMDGITALQIIHKEKIAPVLMLSYYTAEGAEVTFEAISLGAFDYVQKPEGTISDMKPVRHELIEKIKAAALPGILEKLSRSGAQPPGSVRKSRIKYGRRIKPAGFKAVAIGVSTGGPKTLFEVLPYLPADLPAAVFLVQHMPPKFISSYARRIDSQCEMECVEAKAGMLVEPGNIYIAGGASHLTLYRKLTGDIVIRTPKKPEGTFIPSVNVMMDSVLEIFSTDTIGVLMTGMGNDGADAMVHVTEAGGMTIAESRESAIVFGMPKEAIERGGAKIVAPCWDIADEIIKAVMM